MAGMGNKYLRVYDIRSESSQPLQFATKAVHGIVVDPFCPYRLASYTEEGIIKLWDIRKNNEAILTLNPENKNNLSKIVFSPTQPGFLASLTKDASHIDLWDIQETCSLQSAVNSSVQKSTQQPSPATSNLMERSVSQLQQENDDNLSIPVLWKSRKTRSSSKKFASFAFIPHFSKHQPVPNTHHILSVHTDGKFESVKVQEACQMTWQPTGGMAMTGKKGLLSYHPAFLDNTKRMAQLQLQEEDKSV
jgi:hypothetical protein